MPIWDMSVCTYVCVRVNMSINTKDYNLIFLKKINLQNKKILNLCLHKMLPLGVDFVCFSYQEVSCPQEPLKQ